MAKKETSGWRRIVPTRPRARAAIRTTCSKSLAARPVSVNRADRPTGTDFRTRSAVVVVLAAALVAVSVLAVYLAAAGEPHVDRVLGPWALDIAADHDTARRDGLRGGDSGGRRGRGRCRRQGARIPPGPPALRRNAVVISGPRRPSRLRFPAHPAACDDRARPGRRSRPGGGGPGGGVRAPGELAGRPARRHRCAHHAPLDRVAVSLPGRALAGLHPRKRGPRPGVRPLPAALAALRDPRRPPRRRATRLRPRSPAHPAARPVAPARRGHPLHLRHRRHPQPRLGRRDGPRGQRLAARRVARGRRRGCAARSSCATQDPARAAAEEIDRVGDRPEFVQVLLPVRTRGAAGHPRVLADLRGRRARTACALAVYAGGASGTPITAGRARRAYYLEEYVGLAQAFQAQVVSLVCEGVLGALPAACRRARRVRVHLAAGR